MWRWNILDKFLNLLLCRWWGINKSNMGDLSIKPLHLITELFICFSLREFLFYPTWGKRWNCPQWFEYHIQWHTSLIILIFQVQIFLKWYINVQNAQSQIGFSEFLTSSLNCWIKIVRNIFKNVFMDAQSIWGSSSSAMI